MSSTPLATLSEVEAQSVVLDLLKTNGDCRLPCWWGLSPGRTSAQEARSFLERLKNISRSMIFNDKGGYIAVHVPQNDIIINPRFEYYVNPNNAVERITASVSINREIEGGYESAYDDPLFAQLMQNHSLAQILSSYGQPSQVLMKGIRGPWQFYLLLSYADAGFLIEYVAPFEEEEGVYFGCPSKANVTLWLWPPERRYSLEEAAIMLFGESSGKEWLTEQLPIEDATSYKFDTFFNVFKDTQNTSCLETPLNLWPEP